MTDSKKELNSRHESLEKSKLQGIQKATNNKPISEETEPLRYRTYINVSEFNQILNELHQTKTDLEDSNKDSVILTERISMLEAEQEILQTYVSRKTETIQQFNNEIIQLKENIKNVERKNNVLPIYLQETFTRTSVIAGGKTRSNVTHGVGTESRFKNENGNHGAQNITEKLQKLCLRLRHTGEEIGERSFLEAERAQRK